MTSLVGSTVSDYKILEKLGEGGMGVVYKAEDLKLDRVVALKFLPHHVDIGEEEQGRFLQEAKAAALLNHPNVCTIYDIGEEGGQQFILMEYVDGTTLRQKIARSPVPVSEAISYGIQIGEALQEAHSKGIVHRDVKADNIMVNSRNQIKVMDFGLAKLKGSLRLTKATSTVGTLAYMAPEQIQGGEVDARSDIFSFGIVLFEMLTGRTPFRGEHEAAMMYSILNEEPESPLTFRPDLPPELAHILSNALEKDPDAWGLAGKTERALHDLNQGLALQPKNGELLIDRAMLYGQNGMYFEALDDLNAAADLLPGRPDIYAYRASAYISLSQLDLAADNLDRALAIAPDYPQALLERGKLRLLQGDKDGARKDLLRVLEIAPKTEVAGAAQQQLEKLDLKAE